MTLGPVQKDPVMLTGLIGRGIAQSRSPAMHMAEAEAQGLRSVYRLLDAETCEQSLSDLLLFAETATFRGLNVTYPFKSDVIPMLDDISGNARAVGAVNTIVFRDGKRHGHNTDLWGFAESVRQGLAGAARTNVLLIGAGGAGAAVAHALADTGASIISIHDEDPARAAALCRRVGENRPGIKARMIPDLAEFIASETPDGIVNATPVGMAKMPGSAFPLDLLRPEMWVADIVYFPLETELLRAARHRGCRVLPGSGMAVFQAVRAFELFTGRPADPDRMKATFEAFDKTPAAAGPKNT